MGKAAASGKEVIPHEPPAPRRRSESLREAYLHALGNPEFSEERLRLIDAAVEKAIADEREVAFREAMANCQHDMKVIATDAANPQTHSRYATYAKLVKELAPIYTRYGFSVEFDTGKSELGDNYIKIIGEISHEEGFSKTRNYDSPIVTTGIAGKVNMTISHARVSAVTYGKRAVLALMFNIAVGEVDDDGNAAGGDKQIAAISEADAKEVYALLEESGLDPGPILANYGVEIVEDLNHDQARNAKARLRKTIERNAQLKSDEAA